MSHFTVLTIGNPNDVLAPFNEQDDDYATKHVIDMEELKKDYKKHRNKKESFTAFACRWHSIDTLVELNEEYSKENIQKCDKERRRYGTTKNGKLVAAYEFYNDNAKWDWWQEGGRFSTSDGRILFKDGHSADHGYVKDIDIDGMVERAKAKRAETYDYVMEKFGGKPELKITWRKDIAPVLNRWSELLKKHDYDIPQDVCDYHWKMVDKLRDLYHAQPDVARWEEVFGWGYDIENFLCSREEYIDNFELPLWAICDEDGWYEPTEMGWWAMHADYEAKSWTEQAIEVLKKNIKKDQEEDNELYITTIDCHI